MNQLTASGSEAGCNHGLSDTLNNSSAQGSLHERIGFSYFLNQAWLGGSLEFDWSLCTAEGDTQFQDTRRTVGSNRWELYIHAVCDQSRKLRNGS